MIKLSELLNEADYELYHKSATDAAEEAKEYAESLGYEVDEDSWYREVGMGGSFGRLRPSAGKYHKFSVELASASKQLHFQLYGMEDSNRFELTTYIQ